jgi:hypothetical protein
MDIKHLAGAVAIATGLGLSTLPSGAGVVHAAPSDPPPPCVDCPPGAGDGPSQNPSEISPGIKSPDRPVVEPPVGGGPKSGGRAVQQ